MPMIKNKNADMMIVSDAVCEDERMKTEMYRTILTSEQDFKEGKTKDGFEVLADMKKKYGL